MDKGNKSRHAERIVLDTRIPKISNGIHDSWETYFETPFQKKDASFSENCNEKHKKMTYGLAFPQKMKYITE